jgi:hypothetical protein
MFPLRGEANIAVQLIVIHHQVRIQAIASQSKSDAYERSERCIGFAHNKDGYAKNTKERHEMLTKQAVLS